MGGVVEAVASVVAGGDVLGFESADLEFGAETSLSASDLSVG
jgi:hypothetical protein